MTLPPTPALATDCVVFDPLGRVLLIRRQHEPGVGKHALQAGFVKIGETVESAGIREIREETGVAIAEINAAIASQHCSPQTRNRATGLAVL